MIYKYILTFHSFLILQYNNDRIILNHKKKEEKEKGETLRERMKPFPDIAVSSEITRLTYYNYLKLICKDDGILE